MPIRYFHLLLLLMATINSIYAQTQGSHDVCAICKEGDHTNDKPYKLGIKNEIPYIIASAGFLASGLALELLNTTEPFTENELNNLNRNDINPFDRNATYNWNTQAASASDILEIGVIILPAVFLSTYHTRSDFGNLLIMGIEVGAINYGLTISVKNITNRPRPYTYNPEVPLEERTGNDSKESFFSGHVSHTAAFSFFCAKVMNDYHPNMKTGIKIGMWGIAASIPAVTAYLRVEAGQHFPTDVIAGYVAGAFTGWLIPHLHKKKKQKANFSLSPINYFGTPGMYFSLKF